MKKTIILAAMATGFSMHSSGQTIIEIDGTWDRQAYDPGSMKPKEYLVNYAVSVAAGKSLSKQFWLGINLGYGYEEYFNPRATQDSLGYIYLRNTKSSLTSFNMGVWGRVNYPVNDIIYVYAQGNASLVSSYGSDLGGAYNNNSPITTNTYTADDMEPTFGFAASLFPAIGLNLLHGYGLQANIGGLGYTYREAGDNGHYSQVGITLGCEFRLGLHKTIMGRKQPKKAKD